MDRLRHPRVELIHHGKRKERGGGVDVNFRWSYLTGGERENRFPIKGKDVGVKGQRVRWEGITGLRLLHVSLLGLQSSLAWK